MNWNFKKTMNFCINQKNTPTILPNNCPSLSPPKTPPVRTGLVPVRPAPIRNNHPFCNPPPQTPRQQWYCRHPPYHPMNYHYRLRHLVLYVNVISGVFVVWRTPYLSIIIPSGGWMDSADWGMADTHEGRPYGEFGYFDGAVDVVGHYLKCIFSD